MHHIQNNLSDMPHYVPLLLAAFTPGPIQFSFPNNKNISPESILSISQQNPSEFETIFEAINPNMQTLENAQPVNSILPTLIECSDNTIHILRPGAISYQEIRTILPKNIILEKKYSSQVEPKYIQLVDTINPPDIDGGIVIGTKEKLREIFQIDTNLYFKLLQKDGITLINVGSQTSPASIAKNIQQRLSMALNLAKQKQKIFLLNQNWGNHNWGEITRYIISQSTFTN